MPTQTAAQRAAAKKAELERVQAEQAKSRADRAAAEQATKDAAKVIAERKAAEVASQNATTSLATKQNADNAKKSNAFAPSADVIKFTDHGATVEIVTTKPLVLHVHDVTENNVTRFDVNLTGITSTHVERDEKKHTSWLSVDDTLLSEPQTSRVQAIKYALRNVAYRQATADLTSRAIRNAGADRAKLAEVTASNALNEAKAACMTALLGGQPIDEKMLAIASADTEWFASWPTMVERVAAMLGGK